jgi:hypothetical protein
MTTQDHSQKRDNKKRAVAIGLVGLGIAGLAAASAATLNVDAHGTDHIAGGSADVTVTGAGLEAVRVDLGRTGTAPQPVWNIDDNWPGGTGTVQATLSSFGWTANAVPGTFQVAVFDQDLESGSTAATPIAEGTASFTEGATLAVPLALQGSATWGDVLENAKSVTVVFQKS